jgi:hypothetical protein
MNTDNETKHERFRRIASKRTNDVIDRIRILGNCANRSSYEYADAEVNKIFSEIENQLKLTKLKFAGIKRRQFTL